MTPPRLRLRRSWGIPLLLAASGWIVLAIMAAGGPAAIRIAAVFAFVLVCPGTALIRLLPFRDGLERAVLAVALGLSLAVLTGETSAIGRPLRPGLVLVVLASVCTVAALAELIQEARARTDAAGRS